METREETKFGPTYASFTDIVAPRELDKALGLIGKFHLPFPPNAYLR